MMVCSVDEIVDNIKRLNEAMEMMQSVYASLEWDDVVAQSYQKFIDKCAKDAEELMVICQKLVNVGLSLSSINIEADIEEARSLIAKIDSLCDN